MTSGSSQGLFVVVSVVIFGIFVLISYFIFRDTMKPSLANIYCDAFGQVNEQTEMYNTDMDKCIDEKFTNSLDKQSDYQFKLRIGTESGGTFDLTTIKKENINEIVEFDITNPEILSQIDSEGYLSRKTNDVYSSLGFQLSKFSTKKSYIDAGFPTGYNDRQYKVSFSSNFTTVRYNWGFGDVSNNTVYSPQTNNLFKIKVNEVNEFTFTFENSLGGKTVFKFKIKPIADI